MQYDSYFFDMDQTLTRSKSEIEPAHFELLNELSKRAPVIVVSGAVKNRIEAQIGLVSAWSLAQNGNHAITPGRSVFWEKMLNKQDELEIHEHINKIARTFGYEVNTDTLQDRGCQVSFSFVGHNADLAIKEQFDPGRTKRKMILDVVPFENERLTVKIGGTTCLDYTLKNGTKGANVKDFIERMGFKNPIYVGDALFEGGNDSSVVGVCETLQVDSIDDTYQFINKQITMTSMEVPADTRVVIGSKAFKKISDVEKVTGFGEMMLPGANTRWVMVSGGFDPVHVGHLRMFEEARQLGDRLLVVLNCDNWLIRKKGRAFMSQDERAELIAGFKCVDKVYILETDSNSVCEALEKFKPAIFANGGDRKADNIPEYDVCNQLGIKMEFGVGGGKIQSSSEMLAKYNDGN